MAKRICIDAGHYGKYNKSPVVPSYYESDMVWKLHLIQKEILESYGFEVVTTRGTQGKDKGLYNRGYAAKGCDLFISDHSNACGSESVDYPVVYRGFDNIGNCDELALKLAKTIAETMGTAQVGRTATRRGSSGGEYYGVLRGARAAGLSNYYIIEHSFHTNKKMTEWLLDDNNLRNLAEAECKVIAEYYGLIKTAGKVVTEVKTSKPQEQEKGFEPYMVITTCDALNIRSGVGTNYRVTGTISEKEGRKNKYTITEEKNGWGRLKSGAGWIYLKYTKRVDGKAAISLKDNFNPYMVITTCDALNIRSGAGTNYRVTGTISEKEGRKNKYTITEEKNGWGRLKSGAGWIYLKYTKKSS